MIDFLDKDYFKRNNDFIKEMDERKRRFDLKMKKIWNRWLWGAYIVCLFFIYQMFFAPANRVTIVCCYLNCLVIFIVMIYHVKLELKRSRLNELY